MPLGKPQLLRKAQKIKLVAMDVDGVLTAGDVIILKSGEEVKLWNSKDRMAMALVRDEKPGIEIAWITGRSSESVEAAAKDLGVPHLVQKCHDKKGALAAILKRRGLEFGEAAYIGDDLIDLPALKASGFSACPSDAVRDVVEAVDYVSPLAGGRGSVRDVMEFILRAQKKWNALVQSFVC